MDDKQKNIIERNRSLLVGNIILTEEFYDLLRTEYVLPETMIKDIQDRKTQDERNRKLLETLKLRGGDAYRKFRHVLYLTGHLFLADQLYGEDIDAKILRADEIFGKFPTVFNHVSDDMKSKLLRYLESKVKEKALTNEWMKTGQDRSEVLEAKKANFDNEKDFRIRLATKNKKILLLKNDIMHLKDELQKRESEMYEVRKEMQETRYDCKEELNKQSRFNAANNHSILQLRGRFDGFNERVRILNVYIREFLDADDMETADDPDNVKISLLERNVKKMVNITRCNIETSSSSVNEKEMVLNMLKASSRQKQQTISEVVRHYVEKQEKGKQVLSKQLEELLDVVRGNKFSSKISVKPRTDMKLLKSQVATLRVEVEHMKKKLDWKDSKISDLIEENTTLRDKLSNNVVHNATSSTLPNIQKERRSVSRSSPDSNRDMERVYQQFESYMDESRDTSYPVRPEPMRRRGSLADVNLERDIIPLATTRPRRNSKFDAVDLDLFGTRNHGDIKSSSLSNLNFGSENIGMQKTESSPRQLPPFDSTKTTTKTNGESRKKIEATVDPTVSFAKEGRRPSLAELITIYETSNENSVDNEDQQAVMSQTKSSALPVLLES